MPPHNYQALLGLNVRRCPETSIPAGKERTWSSGLQLHSCFVAQMLLKVTRTIIAEEGQRSELKL